MHTNTQQCRHIHPNGLRCQSPCLRHEPFCYYHHTTRRPIQNPKQRRSRQPTFDLPLPDTSTSIQLSLGEVLRRIASNSIDPRRAGLLLYGLQIASLNLPKPAATAKKRDQPSDHQPQPVEEIVEDPTHGPLAPEAEYNPEAQRPKSTVQLLLESFDKKEREAEENQPIALQGNHDDKSAPQRSTPHYNQSTMRKRNLLLTAVLAATPALAQQATVIHTAAELAQLEAKLTAAAKASPTGAGIAPIDDFHTYNSILAVRVKTGEAELHKDWADQIIIEKGTVTLVTGGTLTGEHPVPNQPGEIRAAGIQGGTEVTLHPGDVVHIPAGLPHWVKLAPGAQTTYIVFKEK